MVKGGSSGDGQSRLIRLGEVEVAGPRAHLTIPWDRKTALTDKGA